MGSISCHWKGKGLLHPSLHKNSRKMKSSTILLFAAVCCMLFWNTEGLALQAASKIEEEECNEQGAACRTNGGSVDECAASVRACKEAISGGPPLDLIKDEVQGEQEEEMEFDGVAEEVEEE